MTTLLDTAADLFLGSRCPGCDGPGRGLCSACRAELEAGRTRFAGRDPNPPGFPPTVSAGDYAGVLPALIAGFKDERLLGLAGPLADRVARSVLHLLAALGRPGEGYALVPVPSARAAVRERGLDHTALLARRAATRVRHAIGLDLRVTRLLRAGANPVDQVGLAAAARWANRRHHFAVRGRLPPGVVPILVDDVTTTGATLAGSALALAGAGAPVLGAAVVAATVRRVRPRDAPGR